MPQPSSNSITPRFLVELLDEHGVPCDDVLAAAGLGRSDLDSPDIRTPWRQLGELWRRAAQAVPDVGLILNTRFPPGVMHIVTHVAIRSDTVGEAFDACGRCFSLMSTVERFHLEPGGESTAITYRCDRGVAEIPWLVEHYFALIRRILSQAIGRPLPLAAVEFRAPAFAPAKAYLESLGIAPEFRARRSAIVLSTRTLKWPLTTRDAYLREVLERVLPQYSPLVPVPRFSDRVRTCLASTLLQGRSTAMSHIATTLATSVPVLRSKLGAEGCTYRTLLDETRRDLAREHLLRGLSASEVAYLLGFSEPAGFQHACRRWFGVAAGAVHRLPPAAARAMATH